MSISSPDFTSRYKYYITSKYKSQAPKIVLAISQQLINTWREKVFKMCFKNQPCVGAELKICIDLCKSFNSTNFGRFLL